MDNKFFIQCFEDYIRKDYESFIEFMKEKGFSSIDVDSFDFNSYTDINELEDNLKDEIYNLENELNDLEYKIEGLESEIDDKDAEIKDLQDTLSGLNVIY